MSDSTPRLDLPLIAEAQAQKHVTHNEALLSLDALAQLSVLDRDLASPPTDPSDGDAYLVAPSATGDWAGHEGHIAVWNGGWHYHEPREGWLAWVADEDVLLAFDGSQWLERLGGRETLLNGSPFGATTVFHVVEEELPLSGASVDSTIVIPDRAIVFAVTTRTTEAISGATSYDCGIDGEPAKFGGSLGVAAGSTNSGVIGPTAFYADTPVRITANGGDFTGGKTRICIHYMLCTPPTS